MPFSGSSLCFAVVLPNMEKHEHPKAPGPKSRAERIDQPAVRHRHASLLQLGERAAGAGPSPHEVAKRGLGDLGDPHRPDERLQTGAPDHLGYGLTESHAAGCSAEVRTKSSSQRSMVRIP